MNASVRLAKNWICLVFLLVFAPPLVFGQEQPVAAAADASAAVVVRPAGAALNATDEELAGILSTEDRAKAASRWENAIAKLEELDRTEPATDDGVLLLGSSSIVLWHDAAEGLAPYPVIRRGYGGARFSDLVVFAGRLSSPHQYRAVVIFVANDIYGAPADRSVESVRKLAMHVVETLKKHNDEAPILIVEVTPTPSRWKAWPEIRELNAMLRELCLTQPNVYHVPTAEYYLTADAMPRPELFLADQLHLNEAGYVIFADLIRRRLNEVLAE